MTPIDLKIAISLVYSIMFAVIEETKLKKLKDMTIIVKKEKIRSVIVSLYFKESL